METLCKMNEIHGNISIISETSSEILFLDPDLAGEFGMGLKVGRS